MNIEAERVRNGMTKDALASKLGIAFGTYSGYVSEERPIPSSILLAMARMFHCSTDYLLGFNAADDEKKAVTG